MRVIRTPRDGVIFPGIESVIIDGFGCVNFRNGVADLSEQTADVVCAKGLGRRADAQPRFADPGPPSEDE